LFLQEVVLMKRIQKCFALGLVGMAFSSTTANEQQIIVGGGNEGWEDVQPQEVGGCDPECSSTTTYTVGPDACGKFIKFVCYKPPGGGACYFKIYVDDKLLGECKFNGGHNEVQFQKDENGCYSEVRMRNSENLQSGTDLGCEDEVDWRIYYCEVGSGTEDPVCGCGTPMTWTGTTEHCDEIWP
jgi:predicted Rdx family selenoprotein